MWEWLSGLWRNGLSWLGNAMDNMTGAIIDALQGMGTWLSNTFGALFEAITGFLSTILQPLLDLIGGLVYLLMNLVDVVILVIQSLLLLVQVLLAVVGGLFRSFAALAQFDPSSVPVDYNPFGVGTALVLEQFSLAGGDVIAGVLAWAVWFALAVAVVRLLARDRSAT